MTGRSRLSEGGGGGGGALLAYNAHFSLFIWQKGGLLRDLDQ